MLQRETLQADELCLWYSPIAAVATGKYEICQLRQVVDILLLHLVLAWHLTAAAAAKIASELTP